MGEDGVLGVPVPHDLESMELYYQSYTLVEELAKHDASHAITVARKRLRTPITRCQTYPAQVIFHHLSPGAFITESGSDVLLRCRTVG